MLAKIIVERSTFVSKPGVLHEIEHFCTHVGVEDQRMILSPKPGYIIPIVALLTKSYVSYSLRFDAVQHQPVDAKSESHIEVPARDDTFTV